MTELVNSRFMFFQSKVSYFEGNIIKSNVICLSFFDWNKLLSKVKISKNNCFYRILHLHNIVFFLHDNKNCRFRGINFLYITMFLTITDLLQRCLFLAKWAFTNHFIVALPFWHQKTILMVFTNQQLWFQKTKSTIQNIKNMIFV